MKPLLLCFLVILMLASCTRQIDENLVRAAANGETETIKQLLAKGADIEAVAMKEWTPLTSAAEAGHLEAVKVLIEAGARIDGRAPGGVTALQLAAGSGQESVVRFLLEAGADPNAINPATRRLLIEIVRQKNHARIEELLMQHGFEVPDQ